MSETINNAKNIQDDFTYNTFGEQLAEMLKRIIYYYDTYVINDLDDDETNEVNETNETNETVEQNETNEYKITCKKYIDLCVDILSSLIDGTARTDILCRRFNIFLKVNNDGTRVNPMLKVNLSRHNLIRFNPHQSLLDNDYNNMVEFASNEPIFIFPNVSLLFFLNTDNYSELIFNYIQSLFFISQILLAKDKETVISEGEVVKVAEQNIELKEFKIKVIDDSVE